MWSCNSTAPRSSHPQSSSVSVCQGREAPIPTLLLLQSSFCTDAISRKEACPEGLGLWSLKTQAGVHWPICLAKAACPLAHNRDAFPDGSASWRMRLNDPQWDWNAGEWGGVGGRRGEGWG